MNENTWWKYVERVMDGDSALAAGRKVGIDGSSFTRWKKGEQPGVFFVTKFARAYGRNVLEALVAGGMITEQEAGLQSVQIGVDQLSTEALALELLERVRGTP
jgi:hypothetical protein